MPRSEPSPRRRRDPATAVLLGALLFVLLTVGAAVRVLSGDSTAPDVAAVDGPASATPSAAPTPTPSAPAPTPAATPPPPAGPLPLTSVVLLHPGGSGDDNPEQVPLAVDGDPATAWTTQRYASRDFGGLRPGVGLRFDLGSARAVASVRVLLPDAGADVRLHAGNADGDALVDGTPVSTRPGAPAEVVVDLPAPVTARYWVVWLERLPEGGRGGIAEATFTAA